MKSIIAVAIALSLTACAGPSGRVDSLIDGCAKFSYESRKDRETIICTTHAPAITATEKKPNDFAINVSKVPE